jgi:hypothetical protein
VWRDYRDLYSFIFVVLACIGISLIAANATQQEGPWLERLLEATQHFAAVVVGSTGLALALTETWRLTVVLAKRLEDWFEKAGPKPMSNGDVGLNDATPTSMPARSSTSRCRARGWQ